MKKGSRPSKIRLVFEQLEPRVLFSADPLFVPFDGGVLQADVEQQSILHADLFSTTNPTSADVAAEVRRELVFVDSSVPDYQQLVDDVLATGDDARQFEVVVLDGDRNGIEQMADTLTGRNGIDAIHIISHGSPAELQIGNSRLTFDSMTSEYADELAVIGQALTDSADLLIYGCSFGQGDLGQEAAARLAQLTGADVATSIDDTGSTRYGGDWNLERATGAIETNVAFSQSLQQNWEHLLNVTIDTTSVGTTPIGASSDTVSHTTSGSDRLMLVGISFGLDQGDAVSSVTYNGTALTLVGARDNNDTAASRVEIWSLVAPDTGTYNVDVTFSGTNHKGATIGVMTFNGVDQTTALGSFASAEGDSSNPSATVSSATGELVFGVAAFGDSIDYDLTEGVGQTEHWDLFAGEANGAGTTEAGSTSVVTSWSVPTSGKWVVGGVSIKSCSDDTGFKNPSATGDDYSQWTNPGNVFASDDSRAREDRNGQQQDWYDFGLGVPGGATITGIEVKVEAQDPDFSGNGIDIELSWDGGASYTSTGYGTATLNMGSDVVYTYGGPSDTWGRTWSGTELSDANFRLRLTKTGTDFTSSEVDHIQVRVLHDGCPANTAPTAADNTVVTDEDVPYPFTVADFGFSDVDAGDSLQQVQITSLETAGSLQLSGSDVLLNDVILLADITAGNLTFTPALDANGPGYDSFQFKVHDGTEYSASVYTMTVDVTPTNDEQVLAVNTGVTVAEASTGTV
ncbi:MAG: DUF4347 domain-containing protein, partial [Gammaproteobacteria bacterium]|nr:DUF4347 domain-containing protein [Gammaproteobacteria bacterium]